MAIVSGVSNGVPKPPSKSAASRLRAMLADPSQILVCPGVYDGLSARIALESGFDALYMTGAGTTASLLGQPDLALLSLPEMASNAASIAALSPTTPLIADADTGFGSPLTIRRAVHAYVRGGAAALHLEDQVTGAKRCGHLNHKEVVGIDEFVTRIRAAVLAREECKQWYGADAGDIVIIARTDALQTHSFAEAIARLRAAADAGADVAFLEGLMGLEQMKAVCKALSPTPVLLNLVKGGVTPEVSVAEARDMGFKVVIYPCWGINPVLGALREAGRVLRETGREMDVKGAKSIRDVFEICGLRESVEFDKRAGGGMREGV